MSVRSKNCHVAMISAMLLLGSFPADPAIANEPAIEVLKLTYEGFEVEGSRIVGAKLDPLNRSTALRLLKANRVPLPDGTTEHFFTVEIAEGRIASSVKVGDVFNVCIRQKLCMTARRLK